MKNIFKFATLTLVMFSFSANGFSAAKAENLVRGIVGPVGSNVSWSGYSVVELIPGAGLIPVTSTTTVFYLGFTAGTQADINNMALYTTARGSQTITAVTPVTLGGISDPSIMLSNTSVCPVAPSTSTPCIVRFDPTTLTLSPASDYYLIVYFTNDSNNSSVGATQANNGQSSLSGNYFGGTNYTTLTVGQSLPGTGDRGAVFLMYVMNN